MHGDLDQKLRMKILQAFRDGELKLLIASDVAARGLDIPNVSHIFNFDVPIHSEDYVHRIGRTGRAGLSGKSITIATPSDQKYLDAIEALLKTAIPRSPAPEGFEISEEARQPARREEARGKGRGEPRSRDRDDRRSRPVKPHDAEAPMTPFAPAESSEPAKQTATAAEAPRDETAERPAPRPAARGGRHRDEDRKPEERKPEDRKPEGRRDGGRRDAAVVGMGDHVPDFLMRAPLRVPGSQDD